jgi:malate dehydrogenase
MSPKEPIRVLITGAAGQIAYSLVFPVANGDVFGKDQPIILHLLDIEPMASVLHAVTMELQDCSLPLLKSVVATTKEEEAFKDLDAALLVGAMPRKEGMERKDLLRANVKIFKSQGAALEKFAKKTVKVVVVGNPANTNALIASKYAPSIPPKNFSALTRLDMNRAKAQIAAKVGVPCDHVRRAVIWGNHSNTQFADAAPALVKMLDGHEIHAKDAIKDDAWVKGEFLKCVQTRGAEVIKARKLSSAMSAAKAVCDHMRDWWHGSDEWVSMAVMSDGSYGQPAGLMYSFPVTIDKNRDWHIVQGVHLDDWALEKLKLTADELAAEKHDALAECQD